ncbi:MAG: hypothetical protein Q8R36_03490 [bacterium]|nr:hypothetical protein [bacterium]
MKFFEKIAHNTQKHSLFSFNSNVSHFVITPYRDWFLLIIAGAALGVALVSVSVYLFFIFNNHEAVTTLSSGGTQFESIDETKLKTALILFEEKKNIREKLLTYPPLIVDPSL